jgi:hypothetical protein
MQDDILRRAFEVFPTDAAAIPPLTLRGGNAVDHYAAPRLATLTPEQEALIVAFLEHVAFGEDSTCNRDLVMQVLEEWWLPNALYRR